MVNMLVYFTATTPTPRSLESERFIDPYTYFFSGEELLILPNSVVICVPCQNTEPDHVHNMHDCILQTFSRGWDRIQPHDFIKVFVLDNENTTTTLCLESGELLSTFLINEECVHGVTVNICYMGVNLYMPPLVMDYDELAIDTEEDTGYGSMPE